MMKFFSNRYLLSALLITCSVGALVFLVMTNKVLAVVNPQSGSIGLQGTLNGPPPSQAPTITTPTSGQNFTSIPITVSGICTNGLLIKIYSNNIFVGSAECINGSFKLQISLFIGRNDIIARIYDNLDQAGPDSNTVTVTFTSTQFINLGPVLTITSTYAKRGANPGQQLTWPITISGGTAPYALSIDWGDGSTPDLISEATGGAITLVHTYQNAGAYTVTIKVSDKNGETAFLQVVGIANGPAGQSTASKNGSGGTKIITQIEWWPSVLAFPLIGASFWLGRRSELVSLRRQLEQSTNLLR